MDMRNGVAIVTGSSSGVGAACARRLAALGSRVVVNYAHNADGAQATAADCHALGVETLVVQADVADDAACRAMVAAAVDKWGRLDALVNNAGTTKFCAHTDLDGLDAGDFQRIYGVNVVGPYQMARAALPHMKAAGRGAIVNVASMAGVNGVGSSIAYSASKGALITMTKSLARALGPQQVRVNAVCPGFIAGDWLEAGLGTERYQQTKAFLEANAPLRGTATPDTVAEAIVYLITGGDLVTGQALLLDAGWHLAVPMPGQR